MTKENKKAITTTPEIITAPKTKNNEGRKETTTPVTMETLRDAMKAADVAKRSTNSIFAEAYINALQAMKDAFAGYNAATLSATFDRIGTLAAFFTMGEYSALSARFDKGHACHVATGRATRLPVGEYIKAKGDKLPGGEAFNKAVTELTKTLRAFIKSEVTYDPGKGGAKAVKIAVPVDALKAVIDAVGLPEVYARPRDIRFLTMAVTGGASTIGALARVTKGAVEAYLVDVFRVQLNKGSYAFEKANKKTAAAE